MNKNPCGEVVLTDDRYYRDRMEVFLRKLGLLGEFTFVNFNLIVKSPSSHFILVDLKLP